MRVRKDIQKNLGIINTIRNLNKLNHSHNINLTSIQYPDKKKTLILPKNSPNNNNPIKVKLVKNSQNQNLNQTQQNYSQYNKFQTSPQKKIPMNKIYKDQVSKMNNNSNKLCNSSSKILDEASNNNNSDQQNINQTEINKLRHSLIYAKEKQNQIENEEKENQKSSQNCRKYISMSPKLTLRYNDENDEVKKELKNKISRGFVIQKNTNDNNNINDLD